MPVVLVMVGLLVYASGPSSSAPTPAQIALLSLIPAYGTVAFITQIGTVVWLIAGMAASAQVSVLLESRNKTTGGGVGVGEQRRQERSQEHDRESSDSPSRNHRWAGPVGR